MCFGLGDRLPRRMRPRPAALRNGDHAHGPDRRCRHARGRRGPFLGIGRRSAFGPGGLRVGVRRARRFCRAPRVDEVSPRLRVARNVLLGHSAARRVREEPGEAVVVLFARAQARRHAPRAREHQVQRLVRGAGTRTVPPGPAARGGRTTRRRRRRRPAGRMASWTCSCTVSIRRTAKVYPPPTTVSRWSREAWKAGSPASPRCSRAPTHENSTAPGRRSAAALAAGGVSRSRRRRTGRREQAAPRRWPPRGTWCRRSASSSAKGC